MAIPRAQMSKLVLLSIAGAGLGFGLNADARSANQMSIVEINRCPSQTLRLELNYQGASSKNDLLAALQLFTSYPDLRFVPAGTGNGMNRYLVGLARPCDTRDCALLSGWSEFQWRLKLIQGANLSCSDVNLNGESSEASAPAQAAVPSTQANAYQTVSNDPRLPANQSQNVFTIVAVYGENGETLEPSTVLGSLTKLVLKEPSTVEMTNDFGQSVLLERSNDNTYNSQDGQIAAEFMYEEGAITAMLIKTHEGNVYLVLNNDSLRSEPVVVQREVSSPTSRYRQSVSSASESAPAAAEKMSVPTQKLPAKEPVRTREPSSLPATKPMPRATPAPSIYDRTRVARAALSQPKACSVSEGLDVTHHSCRIIVSAPQRDYFSFRPVVQTRQICSRN